MCDIRYIAKYYSDFGEVNSNFETEYNPQVETFNIDSNPTRFGWYVMDSQVTGNKPFTYGILLQLKRLSYYIQIAYDIDSGKMARRYRTGNNAWSDWTYYITNTDLDGINLTLAYTPTLIPNGNPHLCIKDAIEKKKIPENKVVILNIQNGSEFWAIGKWHNWNPTYASFIIGGYGFAGIGQLYVNGNNKWMWKSDKSSNFVEV